MSSPATGLAQARHGWREGCGLLQAEDGRPAAWAGRESWQLLENGFGLGLNFLASWQAWCNDPQRPARLFYTAIEAAPGTADDIRRGLEAFPQLQALAEPLAAQWRTMLPGSEGP